MPTLYPDTRVAGWSKLGSTPKFLLSQAFHWLQASRQFISKQCWRNVSGSSW